MTWQPAERTAAAQAIYAAAEQDRAERPERYRFDAGAVVERACRLAGSDPATFAPGWERALDVYLASAAEDARLNAVGIRMVLQAAAGRLAAGALTTKCLQDNPEMASRDLLPPIVIIGGWRTGTTFLFRLLGTDPRLHAPLPSELAAPWLCTDGPKPEITTAATQLLHTLNPDMAHIHPSGPALAEECVLGLGTDLRNWGFTATTRLPSYARWLAGEDLSGTYARYRDGLRLLAAPGAGKRLVLKAPAHTAELDHVATAFPGAVVVQIHRDIVETLTSGTSLFAVYRSTYSDDVDAADVGDYQLNQSELWLRRSTAFRASPAADAVTFVDIDYRRLIADTAACLTQIYTAAGMQTPPRLDEFTADYHAAHPRQTGMHRYTPEEFGFDPGAVGERFSVLGAGSVPS